MEYGKTLIDRVFTSRGWTRYRIAKEIAVSQSFLGKVYAGQKPIPPAMAAKLAAIAGADPRESALAALIDAETDNDERARLAQMFGMPVPSHEPPKGGLLQTIP